jgi:rhamnose transport system ATP-binding protein
LNGKRAAIHSPVDALRSGLAYLPEDRRRHGVILEMPVGMNITLASLQKISNNGFLNAQSEQAVSEKFTQNLRVKTPSTETLTKNLSGGNQQKVALARCLMTEPKVLILDEPAQGIDVGAKFEIYQLLGKLAQSGIAILMISSDTPELLGMSDRIAVMAKGRIAGVLDREHATPYAVLSLALGHAA